MNANATQLIEQWKKRASRLSKMSAVRTTVEMFADGLSSRDQFLAELRKDIQNLSEWIKDTTCDNTTCGNRGLPNYRKDLAVAQTILAEAEQSLPDDPPTSLRHAQQTEQFNELWGRAEEELHAMGVKITHGVSGRVDKMAMGYMRNHWKDRSPERLDEFGVKIREQFASPVVPAGHEKPSGKEKDT